MPPDDGLTNSDANPVVVYVLVSIPAPIACKVNSLALVEVALIYPAKVGANTPVTPRLGTSAVISPSKMVPPVTLIIVS